ncbi:MAG: dihydrolipoamide acetyltransferase family protein [Pseudomonadota bacterium]
MVQSAMRLPDIGEGVAEAEIAEWMVAVGDIVREDDVIAAVMTDKATIEIPSTVSGAVTWLAGDVGDMIAVGSDLVRFETEPGTQGAAAVSGEPDGGHGGHAAFQYQPQPPGSVDKPSAPPYSRVDDMAQRDATATAPSPAVSPHQASTNTRPLAAPSVRRRARDAGLDLSTIKGTGRRGRIRHDDVIAALDRDRTNEAAAAPSRRDGTPDFEDIKVVGLRRRISERMAEANAKIPHISVIEEVDVSGLEDLRADLNDRDRQNRPKLTLLPFMMRAVWLAIGDERNLNAHYDDEAGVIRRFAQFHVGIATQTDAGLMVPVIKRAQDNDIWTNAAEIKRLADSARDGKLGRDELTGSTLTITSLGPLGALATTPIINHPEVAIVGINKITIRPVWDGDRFIPRRMMNVSCSFDHRVIDGWVAATFVANLKRFLEKPALLFIDA